MSANAVTLTGRDTTEFDFTLSSGAAFGAAPLKELEVGVWGFFAGGGRESRPLTHLNVKRGESGCQNLPRLDNVAIVRQLDQAASNPSFQGRLV